MDPETSQIAVIRGLRSGRVRRGKSRGAPPRASARRTTRRKSTCCPRLADAWQRAGVPAAEGIVAFARGDIETAATSLEKALPHLEKIGVGFAFNEYTEAFGLQAFSITTATDAACLVSHQTCF